MPELYSPSKTWKTVIVFTISFILSFVIGRFLYAETVVDQEYLIVQLILPDRTILSDGFEIIYHDKQEYIPFSDLCNIIGCLWIEGDIQLINLRGERLEHNFHDDKKNIIVVDGVTYVYSKKIEKLLQLNFSFYKFKSILLLETDFPLPLIASRNRGRKWERDEIAPIDNGRLNIAIPQNLLGLSSIHQSLNIASGGMASSESVLYSESAYGKFAVSHRWNSMKRDTYGYYEYISQPWERHKLLPRKFTVGNVFAESRPEIGSFDIGRGFKLNSNIGNQGFNSGVYVFDQIIGVGWSIELFINGIASAYIVADPLGRAKTKPLNLRSGVNTITKVLHGPQGQKIKQEIIVKTSNFSATKPNYEVVVANKQQQYFSHVKSTIGINQYLGLGLELNQIIDQKNYSYVSALIEATFLNINLSNNITAANLGGDFYQSSLNVEFNYFDINAQYFTNNQLTTAIPTQFSNFENQFQSGIIFYPKIFSIESFSVSRILSETTSSEKIIQHSLGASSIVRGALIALKTTKTNPNQYFNELSAIGSTAIGTIRASMASRNDSIFSQAIAYSVYSGESSVSIGLKRENNMNTIELGGSAKDKFLNYGINCNWSVKNSPICNLNLASSLISNEFRTLEISSLVQEEKFLLRLRSFIDLNDNGFYDSQDEMMPTSYLVNGREITHLKSTNDFAHAWIEPSQEPIEIKIKIESIDHPDLSPLKNSHWVVPLNGRSEQIDFPLQFRHDIDGYLLDRSGKPLKSIELVLSRQNDVFRTRSFSDGYFIFEKIAKGSYELSIKQSPRISARVVREIEVKKDKDLYFELVINPD